MAKKVILTIGDCYALNYLINTVLSSDFNVLSSASCAEAITYLHSDLSIKAMVIDIPDVNAENFALLEHVNSSAILKNIKTVVISNSNDENLRSKTMELGSIFLTKPFNPVYLANHLKTILDSPTTIWSAKN